MLELIVIKHISDILHLARKVEHVFSTNEDGELILDTSVWLEGIAEPFTSRMACAGGLTNRTFAMSRNVAAVLESIEELIGTGMLTKIGERAISLEYDDEEA